MKKLFFAIATAMLLSSLSASAQFVQSGKTYSASSDVEKVFNTAEFSYSPMVFKAKADSESATTDFNGLSLDWSQARLVTRELPIYVQYGVGLQYAWDTESNKEDEDYYSKSTTSFLTVKIPVNAVYNYTIPGTSFSVMPYIGLNAQIHLLGQTKYSVTYDGETESKTASLFSEEEGFNRFILGWQIGAKVCYDRYIFGVGYYGPVTSLYKENEFKVTMSEVKISIGIKF